MNTIIRLNDKGRVSFPVKLRTAVNQNVVMVTKGLDRCLWLFTTEEWEAFQTKLMSNASMMKSRSLNVVRHFIAPAQPVEFDKNGRLSIPQSIVSFLELQSTWNFGMRRLIRIILQKLRILSVTLQRNSTTLISKTF